MICNVCFGANGHYRLCTSLSSLELQTIVVVYTNRVIAIIQRFEIERVEHEQIFNAGRNHQQIYSLLVLRYYRLLETVLLVLAAPVILEFFHIIFFVFNSHSAPFECKDKQLFRNSQI